MKNNFEVIAKPYKPEEHDILDEEFLSAIKEGLIKNRFELEVNFKNNPNSYRIKQHEKNIFSVYNVTLNYKVCNLDNRGVVWNLPEDVCTINDINAISEAAKTLEKIREVLK